MSIFATTIPTVDEIEMTRDEFLELYAQYHSGQEEEE